MSGKRMQTGFGRPGSWGPTRVHPPPKADCSWPGTQKGAPKRKRSLSPSEIVSESESEKPAHLVCKVCKAEKMNQLWNMALSDCDRGGFSSALGESRIPGVTEAERKSDVDFPFLFVNAWKKGRGGAYLWPRRGASRGLTSSSQLRRARNEVEVKSFPCLSVRAQ